MSKILLAGIGLGAGFLIPLSTAHAAPAGADSSAQIHKEIRFSVLLEMEFGSIVATPTGGTITLDPASSSRDCAGGTLVCTGSFSWSRLSLTGSDATVEVTYLPSFTLTGPGAPMSAELDFPGGSGATVVISGGSTVIDIGARLHVNPDQVPGPYTGQFSVDVNYQ